MSGALEGIYPPGIVRPGPPVSNATTPYWHSVPHAYADYQSPWPTEPADIVVIGSGISGMSLCRGLLSQRPDLKITLVEARSLCSGATGRNGGHIKTMTFAMWAERKHQFGIEEAIKISEFEHSHLDAMAAAIEADGADCDLVRTEGVEAYYDAAVFEKAVAALEDMSAHAPHLAALHTVHRDTAYLQRTMKLSPRCVGAITVPAASVWPYKWIVKVWADLIARAQLNVQTHTTVHAIDDRDGADYAVVRTSRGDIPARIVVHATNAWLGYLLPELTPFVTPVRANVVHYTADERGNSRLGTVPEYSIWYRYGDKDYDYLISRRDGGVVVGRAGTGRRATSDDSATDLPAMAHLRGFFHEAAAAPQPSAADHVDYAWSGIVSFTQDGVPFVGKLPFPGRSRQFVLGAYHATGMIKAFRCGQAAAAILLGQGMPEDFPTSMLLTEERIRELRRSLDRGKAPVFRGVSRL
ncbi:FAD dependent oxidoreductase-domain-containing protein [Aspergillus floccosus]